MREREHIRGSRLPPQWDARTNAMGESVGEVLRSLGYFSFSIASFVVNYTQMYVLLHAMPFIANLSDPSQPSVKQSNT